MVKLQAQRLKAGLSQSKLAAASGIPCRTIQQYECRQRNIDSANLSTLCSLADACCCLVYDILESPELIEKLKNVT